MFAKNAGRMCVFAAVDFDMVPFGRVLDAVDGLLGRIKATAITASPVHCLFRMPQEHCLLTIGVKRLSWQSLGFSYWQEHLEEILNTSAIALDKLGVKEFARMGFKVMAFLPLGMSHAEMARLMFGSYLAEQENLASALGNLDDPFVQFNGKRNNHDYVLAMTAMTKADITNAFRQIPKYWAFLGGYIPRRHLRKFHDHISTEECFYFDADFFRTVVPSRQLSDFLSSAIVEVESLANACVDHLRAKPVKR